MRHEDSRCADAARRVLVVDDDASSARTLALLLARLGHEATTAFDGDAAVAAAASWRPDIALVDLGLPRIDGCEVARRVLRLPHGESIVLVALTGFDRCEDRLRSESAGFDEHVVKPADARTIARILALPARAAAGA